MFKIKINKRKPSDPPSSNYFHLQNTSSRNADYIIYIYLPFFGAKYQVIAEYGKIGRGRQKKKIAECDSITEARLHIFKKITEKKNKGYIITMSHDGITT